MYLNVMQTENVYVALDIKHAMRMCLIKLSDNTFQFENVNLPQTKSVNEVPLCLTVWSSLHRISLNSHEGMSYGAYRISP
jgi:hypothetical protein